MVSDDFDLATVRAIPMFSNLSDEELQTLRSGLSIRTVSKGETLLTEGEDGGRLYMLLAGQVQVLVNHGSGAETLLDVLEPVEVFGEMSLLTQEAASATVVATEYCHLLTLDGDTLEQILVSNPTVCVSLLRNAFQRIRRLSDEVSRAAELAISD